MQTVLHETLHTMGLDHCIAWKCLMNAFIVDTFDLCPLELKKLEAVTKQPLLEREKALLKVFKKMGYKEEIRRSLKKIAALKK